MVHDFVGDADISKQKYRRPSNWWRAIGGYREAVFSATEAKFAATEKWTTIGQQPGLNRRNRIL
jgi:hypothetical protein